MSSKKPTEYTKISSKPKVIIDSEFKTVSGPIIALTKDSLLIRSSDGIVEVKLSSNVNEFKVNDQVLFSVHGVLTSHTREKVENQPTLKQSGSTRTFEHF